MERVLIIGSSGGIGAALAQASRARGAEVVGLSRSGDGLDVTDEASVVEGLGRVPGAFDRIICCVGQLAPPGAAPEKSLRAVESDALAHLYAVNAIGPLLLLKHLLPRQPRNAPWQFAALSARVGSIGDNHLGGWYGYRASKAALNQMLRTAAIEIARTHRQAVIAALHPGTVATDFTANYRGRHPAVAPEESAAKLLAVLDGLTPAETGCFRDWAGKEIAW
ncbi:C-factor [Pseudoruegeria aquimaris]|uniref:C-factor n=1 Tax=Pseudoruegeria aquimaris TaxID=393663 RepID=A0A1Y5RIQ4_9RHOB|nr:SDR family NAD(P)-dependent oxidoreductase [Pseudoruegeria aquimaris]SLN15646.1 C-factor [Pseudoruegeria aquimaris]